MKKMNIILSIALISSTAFAGGYSLDCSNKNGSIVISGRGDSVKIYDKNFTSSVNLKGLEIWSPLESFAQTEVVAAGKRIILHSETNSSCRETGTLNFTQSLVIRDMKTKKTIAMDHFICENTYATTTGGGDCFSDVKN